MAEWPRRSGAHQAAAWCAVALALALPALSLGWSPLDPARADALHAALLWTRDTAWSQPWRCWTAAWVHGSAPHLLGNLLGTVLVVLLGLAARVPPRAALAWALAWPLTQLGLFADAHLPAYGGLSGVLHAGAAVAALHLLAHPALRGLGAAVLVGLLAKVLGEAPWQAALWPSAALGIAVAPLAHVSGVMSGLLCGVACGLLSGVFRPTAD